MRQQFLRRMALGVSLALAGMAAHANDADGVKIGVLTDMAGVTADATGRGSVEAARLAIEELGGSVLGKPVSLVSGDHQHRPDIGSSMVRKWYDTDGVDVVVDVPNSSVALAVQGIAREKKKLVLFSSPGTTALTQAQCSPYGVQWTYTTYALSRGTATAVVKEGNKRWFILASDYAFGKQLAADTETVVKANGGEVVGTVFHPLNASDFASFLLQAQASQANVVGLASAGGDLVNLIKQAQEFGLTGGKQRLLTFLTFINDVQAMGLPVAQGLAFPTGFYWDADDDTRAWTRRWQQKMGVTRPPSIVQALSYVATTHYLQAAQAAGTFDGAAVNQKMRELPITTKLIKNARIRPEDGRVIMDLYLVEVKKPAESKYPGDFYRILSTVPGDKVFVSLADSECPLIKK